MTVTDSAVPHDSAIPTNTEHARVCNTHHPRGTREHQQSRPATVKPDPYNLQSRESPPPGTATPETLTLSQM